MIKTGKATVLGIALALLGCERESVNSSQTNAPVVQQVPQELAQKTSLGEWEGGAWPPVHEGEIVSIADNLLAKNYYVILDGSGSMKEHNCSGKTNKMRAAKVALQQWSASVPADSNLGLMVFDGTGVSERVGLATNNRNQFIAAANSVQPAAGTPLERAVRRAYSRLTDQAQKQLGYGEYHLVVVTDGSASSGEDPRVVVNEILRESPVMIHTIGFCIGNRHSLNQPGKTNYLAANNVDMLKAGLKEVIAEVATFDVVTRFN